MYAFKLLISNRTKQALLRRALAFPTTSLQVVTRQDPRLTYEPTATQTTNLKAKNIPP